MSSPPPGYSDAASMIPSAGGTIHAMQGGGSSDSPYSPNVDPMRNSVLGDYPATIAAYKGGAENNATRVAIASAVANGASAAPSVAPSAAPSVAPIAVPMAVPVAVATMAAQPASSGPISSSSVDSMLEPIAVSVAAASALKPALKPAANALDPALKPIAVSVAALKQAAAANSLSAEQAESVDILTGNPTARAAIAAVSALAISNLKNSSILDDDVEEKPIKIYGKDYNLPDPAIDKKSEKWSDIMQVTGLDALSEADQKEFKMMIYEEPTCIEEDLLIGTSIKCRAMRKLIYKISMKLLTSPFSVPSGIELTFHNEANVKHLSNVGVTRFKNVGKIAQTAEQRGKVLTNIKKKGQMVEPDAASDATASAASASKKTTKKTTSTASQPPSLEPSTPQGAAPKPAAPTASTAPKPAASADPKAAASVSTSSVSTTSTSASSTSTPTPVHSQASSVEPSSSPPPTQGGLRKRTRRTIRKK
jgi:hypothetical protein